jgi:hypothetical protein
MQPVENFKTSNAGPCQNPELLEATSHYPRILTRLRLVLWYVQREGVFGALRRGARVAWQATQQLESDPFRRSILDDGEALNLQPDEWVEVKSKVEIFDTLDREGKHRGLRFVPEMYDFCGKPFRVFKRVERICLENTPDVRRIKNTVLLEGGICRGGGVGCDRACFHFWREIWLRRVSIGPSPKCEIRT